MDFFESHREIVGVTPGFVHVGVGAGANPFLDFVFGYDFGSGVDAPALRGWRGSVHYGFCGGF